jgi:hypothetical protein
MMIEHLDQVDKLVREMLDAAELLPDNEPKTKTDIQIMLNAMLDRVLSIRIDLLKIRMETHRKESLAFLSKVPDQS